MIHYVRLSQLPFFFSSHYFANKKSKEGKCQSMTREKWEDPTLVHGMEVKASTMVIVCYSSWTDLILTLDAFLLVVL